MLLLCASRVVLFLFSPQPFFTKTTDADASDVQQEDEVHSALGKGANLKMSRLDSTGPAEQELPM